MDRTEFLEKIKMADSQLESEHVPVHQRTLKAYQLVRPESERGMPLLGCVDKSAYPEYSGPNLLDRIAQWYKEFYGDKVYPKWDGGSLPLLIGGQLYHMRVEMHFGKALEIQSLSMINGLTNSMKNSLSDHEVKRINENYAEGYSLIYEMEDLRMMLFDPERDPSSFTTGDKMIQNAYEDRDTAMRCLSGIEVETNNACFHSQQLGEKMLKAFLIAKNIRTADQLKKRPYVHDLMQVLDTCIQVRAAFAGVTPDVALLANVSMDIRYSMEKQETRVAVEAVWASLRVAGITSCELVGQPRRNRTSFDGIRDILGKYTGSRR